MKSQQGVPSLFPPVASRASRSTSPRHMVGTSVGVHPHDQPWTTSEHRCTPLGSQQLPCDPDVEDDHGAWTRLPTSARRYQPQQATLRQMIRVTHHPVISVPIRTTQVQEQPEPITQAGARSPVHWAYKIGLGMLVMLLSVILWNMGSQWWQVTQDDWKYGRPRTVQMNAIVGQDSAAHPTHFIAENLNGNIVVFEVHAGDPTKVSVINGPPIVVTQNDLAPVTLQFKDVNGDGQLDMLIQVTGTEYVFINTNGTFRPLKTGEQVTM